MRFVRRCAKSTRNDSCVTWVWIIWRHRGEKVARDVPTGQKETDGDAGGRAEQKREGVKAKRVLVVSVWLMGVLVGGV